MAQKRVLIVDDSRTSIFIETMILKGHYEVLTAGDGEAGVRLAEAERPDLILMDVVMPRMNGFEACRELRRQEATRSIPVIMVTTRGEGENVESGFGSGCNDYVTKPVDALELLSKVKDHIGG